MELTANKIGVDGAFKYASDGNADNGFSPVVYDADELRTELGVWLSGLESFLRTNEHGHASTPNLQNSDRDYLREMRITHGGLTLCSRLNFRLRRASETTTDGNSIMNAEEAAIFFDLIRDASLINEGLIRSGKVGFGEWSAWKSMLGDMLAASREVKSLIAYAEKSGEAYLPASLLSLSENKEMSFEEKAELQAILPRFARILKWLSVVGQMLRDDEPLKLSLLIFARVHEQTKELISYIDKRLEKFPDETSELFGSLDGASYTASLELKKVYHQELVGLVGVRPAPSVYARIETAYSLLNDSFQQILSGFARIANADITILDLFPLFRVKLDQSILLRDHLGRVLKIVREAEQNSDKAVLEKLRSELAELIENTMKFLFYKDRETIERFGEEVNAAGDKKELVPILHRFGAYLETLFGQVNMRTVLAENPPAV